MLCDRNIIYQYVSQCTRNKKTSVSLGKIKPALQKHTDNAVSKTINFPKDTTGKDMDAWRFYNYDYDPPNKPVALPARRSYRPEGLPDDLLGESGTITLKIFSLPMSEPFCHQRHLYTYP